MHKRRLGRTDLLVTQICLGSMTWGQQNTEAEGHAQMDLAFSRGVNFIDTAELYPIPPKAETQGRTEKIIGSWMKAKGNRDKVILASKVVGRTGNTWFRGDRPHRPLETSASENTAARAGGRRGKARREPARIPPGHRPDFVRR